MKDIWNNCPAQPQALRRSIEEIDNNSELCLHEIENEVSYAESVSLATHELKRLMKPRPLSEWTEEDGDVLWWRFPIEEPPYCGSPNDIGQDVLITVSRWGHEDGESRHMVGGWPGYHTHWTPIPQVMEP